jgi:molecular chaperone DnaK
MVKDAEANAETDKARRAAVEAKNHAESLIDTTEKSLKDYGDKVSDEDRKAIEDAVADLKEAVAAETPDAEAITARTQALSEASMKLGQAMYEAQQAEEEAAAEADAASDAAKDDDVVDADFEEIDDDDDQKKSA